MPLPEGPRDVMAQILAEAAAHTLTERELRLLVSMQIMNAMDALEDNKYGLLLTFLDDAASYVRSLIAQRNAK